MWCIFKSSVNPYKTFNKDFTTEDESLTLEVTGVNPNSVLLLTVNNTSRDKLRLTVRQLAPSTFGSSAFTTDLPKKESKWELNFDRGTDDGYRYLLQFECWAFPANCKAEINGELYTASDWNQIDDLPGDVIQLIPV